MKYNQQIAQLETHLSTHLKDVVEPQKCLNAIQSVNANTDKVQREKMIDHYIQEFSELVFCSKVDAFLRAYYGEGFVWRWPIFDIIDETAMSTYDSTTWHRDGGMKGMLKVFLYLNSVAEHDCTTLIIDEARTIKLGEMGGLPLELDKRHSDVSEYLEAMGSTKETTSFPLSAGDLLIFDPTRLAHRCSPPKPNTKRYTICYCVFPESAFGR
jgi:hypothetical protein